jgi:hypothetical protein
MPRFFQSGEFRAVSFITGPAHVLLQIAFAPHPVADPSLVELPPVTPGSQRTVDPEQIRSAVLDATATTNAELGTSFHPALIRYISDDSPRYDIYTHCTALLIRRMASGEPFDPAASVA